MATTTTKQMLSLLTLPVELLYRIFDELDTKTILLSVRNVCIQLYASANTYNRYHLDPSSISKSEFRLVCR